MTVKLIPALKNYLWGGTNLKNKWNKDTAADSVSEAWELSFNEDAPSIIASGEFAGEPLYKIAGREHWGDNLKNFKQFPVLNKLIDAALPLSVQVHPSDDYALEHEGQYGKTEMWHILDAEENSFLYLGLVRDMTAEEFSRAIENDTICDYLNKVPVKAGETYFIPSGTVHAINGGITLYEVQQNSTLTYRVYDYGRVGADGKKRELHVEKAKAVANLKKYQPVCFGGGELIGRCEYFSAYSFKGERIVGMDGSFVCVTVTGGKISLGGINLVRGETAFVSAGERAEVKGDGSYVLTCVEKL